MKSFIEFLRKFFFNNARFFCEILFFTPTDTIEYMCVDRKTPFNELIESCSNITMSPSFHIEFFEGTYDGPLNGRYVLLNFNRDYSYWFVRIILFICGYSLGDHREIISFIKEGNTFNTEILIGLRYVEGSRVRRNIAIRKRDMEVVDFVHTPRSVVDIYSEYLVRIS